MPANHGRDNVAGIIEEGYEALAPVDDLHLLDSCLESQRKRDGDGPRTANHLPSVHPNSGNRIENLMGDSQNEFEISVRVTSMRGAADSPDDLTEV